MISAATAITRVFIGTPSPARARWQEQHVDGAGQECAATGVDGRVAHATSLSRGGFNAAIATQRELIMPRAKNTVRSQISHHDVDRRASRETRRAEPPPAILSGGLGFSGVIRRCGLVNPYVRAENRQARFLGERP